MKKIKWENITFIIIVGLGIASAISHIKLNGLYFNLITESLMYLTFAFTFKGIVKDIRKNPSNWTL